MGFHECVSSSLGGSIAYVRVLDLPDPVSFSTLGKAVVFLHASWSGPSFKALRHYVEEYRKLAKSEEAIAFYVLNFDKLSHEFLGELPGPLGGNGEAFLVKNGLHILSIPHFNSEFGSILIEAMS